MPSGRYVLGINDCGMVLISPQHGALSKESAYAAVREKEICFGRAAFTDSLVMPRENVCSRFWEDLGSERYLQPFGYTNSHTELAGVHTRWLLTDLDRIEREHLLVVVPATLSETALGLLLGILERLNCTMPTIVLSPLSALAGCRDSANVANESYVLEMGLHRVMLSRFSHDGLLELVDERYLPDRGWQWASQLLAEELGAFVLEATQFDPFHTAALEQQLHNQLDRVLAELLNCAEATVQMHAADGSAYRCSLKGERLLTAGETIARCYAEFIGDIPSASLYVDSHAASIPGLVGALSKTCGQVHSLASNSAVRGALNFLAPLTTLPAERLITGVLLASS